MSDDNIYRSKEGPLCDDCRGDCDVCGVKFGAKQGEELVDVAFCKFCGYLCMLSKSYIHERGGYICPECWEKNNSKI